MTFATDLKRWLTEQVSVAPRVSLDAAGVPTFGVGVTVAARVEQKVTAIPRADGTSDLAQYRLFLEAAAPVVTPGDQVTLADGSTLCVLTSSAHRDLHGEHSHTEILC